MFCLMHNVMVYGLFFWFMFCVFVVLVCVVVVIVCAVCDLWCDVAWYVV